MHVVETQAVAILAAPPDLVANSGRLPAMAATEEEALCAAVEEAQRLGADNGAAFAKVSRVTNVDAGRAGGDEGLP